MISKMLNSDNPAYYEFSEKELARMDPTHYPDLFDQSIYESDEFRMYAFKIKKCPRMRSHDWTQCPFAHRGEKARRRDPRKYNYAAVSCDDFRNGNCRRGDACPLAHGVFEFWLHPGKYRTRECSAGDDCHRKVCFFAHSEEELREEINYEYVYTVESINGEDAIAKAPPGCCCYCVGETTVAELPVVSPSTVTCWGVGGGSSDFLASLSGLTIKEGNEMERSVFGWYVPPLPPPLQLPLPPEEESDLPNIDWVTALVE